MPITCFVLQPDFTVTNQKIQENKQALIDKKASQQVKAESCAAQAGKTVVVFGFIDKEDIEKVGKTAKEIIAAKIKRGKGKLLSS